MSDYGERIYHLKGSPFEIGCAMGQALGPKLEANIASYIQERISHTATFNTERWHAGALPWLQKLPRRFQEEFEGLAQGASLPLERLAEWAYLEVILSSGCSGAIVTIDHHTWVARNNDIFVPGMWGYVTIREVSGRIPTISFGLEGDVFTPTGINREQLWLHYNYVPARDVPSGERPCLPCYAFMVEALETCRTLQDLDALLERIQRDDGMLLFAVDGKNDTFAIYECGCTDFYKREAARGWLVATNHYCIHPQALSLSSSAPLSTGGRYKRMGQLIEGLFSAGGEDSPIKELIRILSDDGIEARNGEIATAYSNVACPGTQEIWYTFGGYPSASRGNWQKLEWPW